MRTDNTEIEGFARKPLPTLRDMVAVLFRQRRKMLITFLVVVVAAIASGKWKPSYEARMKILVLRQRTDAIMSSSANLPAPFAGDQIHEEDMNSEVELLNSEDLLRKVVMTTNLSGDNKNDVKVAKAVVKLSKDLVVEAGRKSDVITVTYKNGNPKLAAQVLQALSVAYIQKHTEMHHSSGEYNFFDMQARQYLSGLQAAQAKLTDFSTATGVVSAETERNEALGHANEFDSTARQAQAGIVEAQERVRMLEMQMHSMQPRITTSIRTADNPQLLQQLKSTLLNLQMKRTELLTKYEPTYRLVKEVDLQIAETKNAIAGEARQPLRDESTGENPNYQWAQQELARAQADLSGLRAREMAAASIARDYHATAQRLDRDQLTQQQLQQAVKLEQENYLLYTQKREEARINDALDLRGIVNVAMEEHPVVPAVPAQSVRNFALAAFMLAIIISMGVAFGIDLLDPTFRTPDELANYLGLPVLAALPKP